MLNMKAMPAAGGAGLAAYLWKEAVGTDEDPVLAIAAQHKVESEENYRQTLADIRVGFLRAENINAAAIINRLDQMEEFDWEGFNDAIDALRVAGLNISARMIVQAREAVDNERTHLDHAVIAAGDPDTIRTFGAAYRGDTSPELADLLKIDLYSLPRLQDLKRLLSGGTADSPKIPGRFYRKDREGQMTMGSLGLMFSADKSVSVIFGLATPEERAAIVSAQRTAVDVAMHQVADKIGVIRSRRGGLDRRDPADVTWVQWQHHQSRRGDPQLHTHITLLNVALSRIDGKVGTLDTYLLHGLYPTIRETYHRELATELRKLDLPVEFDPKVPAAVLTGVPEQVLRHFSARTADGEAWLQRHGVNFSSLTPHQRSTWLNRGTRETRPTKAKYYVPGNGHSAWHARAAGQGYVPPPQFINPEALQKAGIVRPTVETPRQRQAINPRLDARYNRGGGRYDDDGQYGQRR